MIKIFKYKTLLFASLVLMSGCKKLYDLPEEKEYFSPNVNYGNKLFEPILGRTALMGEFNADKSTLPMQFEILNVRYGDGRPATDMLQVKPTLAWIAPYTGKETSLAQIEAKRKVENRPMFEVRSSGQFILWESSTNELIPPRPADSSTFIQDTRFFDLRVKNTGGEKIIKDFQVRPWRERPYEPSNDINPYTGEVARDPRDPRNPLKRDYITPYFNNIVGAQSNQNLENSDSRKDIVVFIRPFTSGGTGNSLRFVFLDKDGNSINPESFNETKWDQLVHGFNMQKTADYVQFDVAYPIPLVRLVTPYTNNDGSRANSEFAYSRKGFGGTRSTASIGLDYSIYRKGNWEIVFQFRRENPKFEDE